jgi:tight adherence protein C
MHLFLTAIVFVVLVVGMTTVLTRLYVRPKAAIDRVVDTGFTQHEEVATHPSLVFRDMLQKLGTMIPASPKDASVMQRRLIRAGIRTENGLKYLYGARAVLGIGLPLLVTTLVMGSPADSSNKLIAVVVAAAAGFFGPNEYIQIRAKKRQKEISKGLPNALDLMVVCVESGLGLDQAIVQVSKELEHAHPDISEEFGLMNLELKAGKRRIEALRNLADRSTCDDLKKLVAVLIQADKFGTGIAQSLRAHADYMRVQARQIAEEKAAKLGVKLVFPIFFCILPSLFVVTVGPVVVKIIRELLPMMNNM